MIRHKCQLLVTNLHFHILNAVVFTFKGLNQHLTASDMILDIHTIVCHNTGCFIIFILTGFYVGKAVLKKGDVTYFSGPISS